MNNDYQLEQLRRMLMDPSLSSGLYLIDTDLNDSDIEIIISGIEGCKYVKESLLPSNAGSSLDLFVTGLSHKCKTEEIKELRMRLMSADSQQKERNLYNLLISMFGYLCSEQRTFIHLCGTCDLTTLTHVELCMLHGASTCHSQKVIIVCKNKKCHGSGSASIINNIDLMGANATSSRTETLIDEKFEPSKDVMPMSKRTIIQNGANPIYVENNIGTINVVSGTSGNVNSVKNEAYFDNIANEIIAKLDKALVSIHVCIAWFTNQRIADKLVEKFNEGVDVKVVSFKDHTNAKFGVNIGSIPHKEVRGSRGGTMHDKFCVIDNQVVITGSYNWSENAENKNDENAAVMYDNDNASKYSVEFRKLFGN